MYRRNQSLQTLRAELFPEPWSYAYNRQTYKFMGHLARFALHDADRLTHQVLLHLNYDTILKQSVAGHQGHTGQLRVWRWEPPIYRALGRSWRTYAFDKEEW